MYEDGDADLAVVKTEAGLAMAKAAAAAAAKVKKPRKPRAKRAAAGADGVGGEPAVKRKRGRPPADASLTVEERKANRAVKNRLAAQRSHQRRLEYAQSLERQRDVMQVQLDTQGAQLRAAVAQWRLHAEFIAGESGACCCSCSTHGLSSNTVALITSGCAPPFRAGREGGPARLVGAAVAGAGGASAGCAGEHADGGGLTGFGGAGGRVLCL